MNEYVILGVGHVKIEFEKVANFTILSLKHGTTDRVLSENAIKLTKSLSLSVSRTADTVVIASSNDFPDIEPDASNKII